MLVEVVCDAPIEGLKSEKVYTNTDKTEIAEAIAAGVDGYLVKPFTLKMLEDNLVVLL